MIRHADRQARLTDSYVFNLTARPREFTIWDKQVSVFGIRVRASGYKSYVLHIMREKMSRRVTLGAVPHLSCEEARIKASQILAASLQRDGAKNDLDISFGALVQGRWHDEHFLACKPSSRRRYKSMLRSQLLPVFGEFKLVDINRSEIAHWFDTFSQSAPGNANRGLILLGQILGFAMRHGLLAHNPVVGMPKNKPRRVMRFLSVEELDRLYVAMDRHVDASLLNRWQRNSRSRARDIVQLLILTGCRKNEILKLRWDEIDGVNLCLKDSKTGPRTVQLPDQARAILNGLTRGEGRFVFPSTSDQSRPISSIDSFWYPVRKQAGLNDVRLHDLRHTFASHAVMQGVPLPVVAKLLGHSKIAMTMRYAHIGDDAAEAAAEMVGAKIAELLDGGG